MNNKSFEIRYQLKTGNNGTLTTRVQAPNSCVAKEIFKQQNPGCTLSTYREVR